MPNIPQGLPGSPFDIVFVDRDGTINGRRDGGYIDDPDDLILLPGAASALARITAAGVPIVLVTNQRGIARGLMTYAQLGAVHERLRDHVAAAGGTIDLILVCPHDVGQCDCRKPAPGLFVQALAKAPWARASHCVMIGDQESDLIPARGLGMRAVRVDERTDSGTSGLADAVETLLDSSQ